MICLLYLWSSRLPFVLGLCEHCLMAASSSSPGNHEKYNYEVFISFRGYDVRRGFLSHLHHALEAEQIYAFKDSDLERGKEISGNLFQIIEQSDLSIVIFSQNYPQSDWCLEELEKIHESMVQRKQIVVPVFYQVDPSDVQDLKGNYAIKQKWRDALVGISILSGFDSTNFVDDANLIKHIVIDVSMKLSEIDPTNSCEEGFFGIDSSIKNVESLLNLDSTNARMVGIWGIGGIGKTTIASKVFDKIKKNFRGQCFLRNVRETSSAPNGLINLRDKIIWDLLGNKDIKISSPFSVDASIGRRLKRTKVLLVLDDVNTCMLLNSVLQSSGLYSPHSFCPGSRIIVTGRDSQVLKDVKLERAIFEVEPLEDDKALQLFSWHAFDQIIPQEGYEKLSKEVVHFAHGVPLALVVLGCELRDKPTKYWEIALKKIETIGPLEIHKILRISFDGLDREEKNIFLDIACFMKGWPKDDAELVLDSFGFYASIGIDRLIDKSLLKVEIEYDYEMITMHDLVQQMGHEIVAEEKERHGQQSRLWKYDDIKDAFANYRAGENVEVISFVDHCLGEIDISKEAFIHMRKLRYLFFKGRTTNCPSGLEYLPDNIKYLKWEFCPINYLPSNYTAEKLVYFSMFRSKLKEINWRKPLKNLKRVDFSWSEDLMKISDLAMAPNLEQLNLRECNNLVKVGSSLKNLNKLTSLDVSYCTSLSHLPELPSSITELRLEGSGLRQLPSTIWHLTLLEKLSLSDCDRLECFPDEFGNLTSLKELFASCTGLRGLPESIKYLKNLMRLFLTGCQDLIKLPEDFGNLEALKFLYASYSGLRELPQSIQNLKNLIKLDLSGCQDLMTLPDEIGNLDSLKELFASDTGLSALPPSVQNLKNLIMLDLRHCEKLSSIPALPSNLQLLFLEGCIHLSSIVDPYSLKMHCQPTEFLQVPGLCVTASGIQVPEWMMYRNECGSSVSLNLETLGHSMRFIFCFVSYPVSFHHSKGADALAILESDETLETMHHFDYLAEDGSLYGLGMEPEEVVFLWTANIDCTFVNEVSFKLLPSYHGWEIIKCGVHPIFPTQK